MKKLITIMTILAVFGLVSSNAYASYVREIMKKDWATLSSRRANESGNGRSSLVDYKNQSTKDADSSEKMASNYKSSINFCSSYLNES